MHKNTNALTVIAVLFIVLFLLASASPALAAPPQQGTVPPPPPPVTGGLGSAGGSFSSPGGDATITFPPGLAPNGSTVLVGRPNLNSLPTGSFRVGGDGDHRVSVQVFGPDGKPITSFSQNIQICFNLTAAEVAAAGGAGNITIDWFNSATGKWEKQTTTAGALPNQFCISVNHLSIFGVFIKPAEAEPMAVKTEDFDLGAVLPWVFGFGAVLIGAVLVLRKK